MCAGSNLRSYSRQGRWNVIRLRSRLAGVGKTRIIDRVRCSRAGRTGSRCFVWSFGDRSRGYAHTNEIRDNEHSSLVRQIAHHEVPGLQGVPGPRPVNPGLRPKGRGC
jgi:hypothetical protein